MIEIDEYRSVFWNGLWHSRLSDGRDHLGEDADRRGDPIELSTAVIGDDQRIGGAGADDELEEAQGVADRTDLRATGALGVVDADVVDAVVVRQRGERDRRREAEALGQDRAVDEHELAAERLSNRALDASLQLTGDVVDDVLIAPRTLRAASRPRGTAA